MLNYVAFGKKSNLTQMMNYLPILKSIHIFLVSFLKTQDFNGKFSYYNFLFLMKSILDYLNLMTRWSFFLIFYEYRPFYHPFK